MILPHHHPHSALRPTSKTQREIPEPPVQLDEEEKNSGNIKVTAPDIVCETISTARRHLKKKQEASG